MLGAVYGEIMNLIFGSTSRPVKLMDVSLRRSWKRRQKKIQSLSRDLLQDCILRMDSP
jgi:hypothetical protein